MTISKKNRDKCSDCRQRSLSENNFLCSECSILLDLCFVKVVIQLKCNISCRYYFKTLFTVYCIQNLKRIESKLLSKKLLRTQLHIIKCFYVVFKWHVIFVISNSYQCLIEITKNFHWGKDLHKKLKSNMQCIAIFKTFIFSCFAYKRL